MKRRRIKPTDDDDEMFKVLNALKQDNLIIMQRLDILEEKLNEAPVSNTSAKTTQKGAFLALKIDWIPQILDQLSLIYDQVQHTDEEKWNKPLVSNVVAKTKSASVCWKLYYQAKFKTFLLKNKITLSDNQAEVITIDVDQPDVNTKWIKIKNNDKYKDIDFQRYYQSGTNIVEM